MRSNKHKVLASATVMSLILTSVATTAPVKAAEAGRLQGANREATAVSVAKDVFKTAENVIIVNGYGYADAVSATPLAKALNAPILLTSQAGDKVDTQALKDLGAKNVYIVGGNGAVKDSLKDELAKTYKVERICGTKDTTRYGTNAAVAEKVLEKTKAKKAVLVSAEGYADALSIASIAAAQGMPVLFANKNEVPAVVKEIAKDLTVQAVGGTAVLPDKVLEMVKAERITKTAKNRFQTNLEVLEFFKNELKDVKKIYMAAGGQEANQFADALVASAAAAKDGAPVVLTGLGADKAAKDAANKYVTDKMDKDTIVKVVGGEASIKTEDVKAVEDKVKEVNGVNQELKVQAVNAINAKQIKVVFTQAVDKTDAENVENYYLNNNKLTSGTDKAELQDDEKSVIITLNTALTNDATNVYQINPIKSKDNATVKTAVFTGTEKFADKVAPTVVSVSSKTNGSNATSVTVNYSEPVSNGTLKIDGVGYSVSAGMSQTVTGLNLDPKKSHTIEFINLADAATPANVTSYGSLTFNVTVDDVAPVVSQVEAYGDKTVLVTFSKAMNASTVGSNIAVKDELYRDVEVKAGTVTALSTDGTGTKFLVPISEANIYADKDTRAFTLIFAGNIEDSLGNKMAAVTKSVSLVKDTTAPAVSDIVFNKDATGKVTDITVKYNEALKAGTILAKNLTIVNKNGVKVTASDELKDATVKNNDKEVKFELKTSKPIDDKWTITVPVGLVTDNAETPNSSTGFTKLLDFTVAAPAPTFTLPASNVVSVAGNKITVDYKEAVKGGAVAGSATDPNNYSINGKILPAGTTIYLDNTLKVAEITLPEGSVVTSDTNAVFRISNVQNAAGTTVTPYTTIISVIDNTKPVLQSAKVLSDKVIELTYNENMATLSAADAGTEFEIKVGTDTLSFADAEIKANNVSGFGNKITLTLEKEGDKASVGSVSPSASGVCAVAGTFTGTSNIDYKVKVTGVDGDGKITKIAVSTDNGTNFGSDIAYTDGVSIGNGLTVTITGTNAANDTFTFKANAATKATLDLTKNITIKTVTPASGIDIKDANNNEQKAGITVNVAK